MYLLFFPSVVLEPEFVIQTVVKLSEVLDRTLKVHTQVFIAGRHREQRQVQVSWKTRRTEETLQLHKLTCN